MSFREHGRKPEDIAAYRFGRSMCMGCGHHPIMHLSRGEILTGVKEPCCGAKEGEKPCTCMSFVPFPADEPAIVLLDKHGRKLE
jgi:hypothetical protein